MDLRVFYVEAKPPECQRENLMFGRFFDILHDKTNLRVNDRSKGVGKTVCIDLLRLGTVIFFTRL